MITWTVTAEQATTPTAAGQECSRGCAADNAIAAALDYFAAATAPTPGLGAHTIAATLLVGETGQERTADLLASNAMST